MCVEKLCTTAQDESWLNEFSISSSLRPLNVEFDLQLNSIQLNSKRWFLWAIFLLYGTDNRDYIILVRFSLNDYQIQSKFSAQNIYVNEYTRNTRFTIEQIKKHIEIKGCEYHRFCIFMGFVVSIMQTRIRKSAH